MSEDYIRFCRELLNTIDALVEKHSFYDDGRLLTFCETLRDFYLSLFQDADGYGFFPATDMNIEFQEVPHLANNPRHPPLPEPTPTPSPKAQPSPTRQGTGKGRPGTPRKEHVTARAKRKRKQAAATTRKRQRILASPERSPSPSSTVSDQTPTPVPADPEPGVLHVQVRKNESTKKVSAFQAIAGKEADDAMVTQEELSLYHNEMCQWRLLDEDGKSYTKLLGQKAVTVTPDATTDEFLDTAIYLKNVASGIANFTSWTMGDLIYKASKESGQSSYDTVQTIINTSEQRLCSSYRELLQQCHRKNNCEECGATLEWDDRYFRYYASDERNIPPPDKEQRPLHCRRVNPQINSLKSTMAGFSETSLLRDRNFSAACPKDSPPVFSLALPTDVQAMSVKYLKPYFNSWVEGELLPPSFTLDSLAKAPENADYLLPLSKESVIFFDGDGGEVRSCPEILTTHRPSGVECMRFRTKFNDAPEAFTAFRFYRKSVDGRLTPLNTRHVGIESLRAARKIITSCVQVFLQLDYNLSPPDIDRYRRRLVNLWIQAESEGPLTAFPVMMARQGFTHEFPMSSEQNVHNAVKVATATKSGLRNLPPECFRFPYRPWDVRRLWSTNPEQVYSSEFQLRSELSTNQETVGEARGECYCKLVSSHLVAESYCYPATSTIPGAGMGLFLRPRDCAIPNDSHLCLYAQDASSEQEINDSGSSRVYAIQAGGRKWFDGEIDTGENIGRFANQSHVKETLQLAVEQADKRLFPSMDWNAVNTYARGKANSRYHYVPREQQLVIRSSQEFPASSTPIEIFTCYGDLQVYWLPLISLQPNLFPPELVSLVQFLLSSEWSNLTEAEKAACSG